jgi:hypothetical protein
MAKRKPKMAIVGHTPDGKPVVDGVFRIFDTIGLPLDSVLDLVSQKGWVVSWLDFYKDAAKAGWTHKTIMNRVSIAVSDCGLSDAHHVLDQLEKLPEYIESIEPQNN